MRGDVHTTHLDNHIVVAGRTSYGCKRGRVTVSVLNALFLVTEVGVGGLASGVCVAHVQQLLSDGVCHNLNRSLKDDDITRHVAYSHCAICRVP